MKHKLILVFGLSLLVVDVFSQNKVKFNGYNELDTVCEYIGVFEEYLGSRRDKRRIADFILVERPEREEMRFYVHRRCDWGDCEEFTLWGDCAIGPYRKYRCGELIVKGDYQRIENFSDSIEFSDIRCWIKDGIFEYFRDGKVEFTTQWKDNVLIDYFPRIEGGTGRQGKLFYTVDEGDFIEMNYGDSISLAEGGQIEIYPKYVVPDSIPIGMEVSLEISGKNNRPIRISWSQNLSSLKIPIPRLESMASLRGVDGPFSVGLKVRYSLFSENVDRYSVYIQG